MRPAPDPYLPGHGDTRYAVEHYDLTLDYRTPTNRLDARAALRIRALTPTDTVRLDLCGLAAGKVKVNGGRPAKATQKDRSLAVRLAVPLRAGEAAVLEIPYAGKPGPVSGPHGPAGWEELSDGILVASQPYGSPSWFPCNDRADDKASYRIRVTTEAEYLAVATGRLVEQSTRAGRTTRVYEQGAPTSPYLVCLHVGRLVRRELGDRTDLVSPRPRPLPKRSAFARLPAMVATLEQWYGPYPFDRFTAVVVDDVLEIPLEAQGMASFGVNHLPATWENERLVVHELAHQWFGNAVTARVMRDIWLHEGFACYTEWLWSQHCGLGTADARAREHYEALRGQAQPSPLADPGSAHMFDDWVYKRGALTLHALRRAVGDEAFFGVLRAWVERHKGGVVDTADFVGLAGARSTVDVGPLFTAWLDDLPLPPFPPG